MMLQIVVLLTIIILMTCDDIYAPRVVNNAPTNITYDHHLQ
jgi:hypothetical protein